MNSKRVHLVCLAGVVLLILLGTPLSARAASPKQQPNPPFQFDPQGQTEFAWDDVKKGEAIVQVLNNTAEERVLSVAVSDMDFKDVDGKELETGKVLKPASDEIILPAGRSEPITFSVEEGVVPKEGTYSGFLHVSDSEVAIHLPITITVSAVAALAPAVLAGEPPVPLVDTWKVRYVRRVIPAPGVDGLWSVSNGFLPLEIDANRGRAIALDQGKPLGYLTSSVEGMAAVSWVGEPQAQPDINKLGIELAFAGLDHSGDYSGKIDLLPDDEEKGEVALTVTVTDFILWPIVAILLGILAAIYGQHRVGVNRNILKLYADEADTKRLKEGPKYKNYKIIDFEWLRGKVRDAIDALQEQHRWSTVTLGADNEAYKEIVERLSKLDEHVQAWNIFDQELEELASALDGVSATLPPRFKEVASRLLNGVSLAFEQLEVEAGEPLERVRAEELFASRREKVVKATRLAGAWPGWVQRLNQAKADLENIGPGVAGELPKVVQEARFELARVETFLYEAPDLDTLENVEMERSLRMAEGLVAGLKRYPPPAARVEKRAEERAEEVLIQPLIPYPVPGELPVEDTKRLRVIERTLWRSDWVMFWLALIGGVYTGLDALYFGQAFGTPLDYVKAVAWGLGTKTVLEVIYAAINRLV